MIRQRITAAHIVEGILQTDRSVLGQALTLAGSQRADDQALIAQVLTALLPKTKPEAVTIGITGPPGAGKSTFIETLGLLLVAAGKPVAVLAVDPSSALSGGSILGDKTRMEELSKSTLAFIRPNPSRGHLGGAAPGTREEIVLCQAAGFSTVLIETVGVGQSETEVAQIADVTILILPPAGGDELQGVKRGIVEIADLLIINKADGQLAWAAEEAMRQYGQAMHLFPPRPDGWAVPVRAVSAHTGKGVQEVWQLTEQYLNQNTANGMLAQHRRQQRRAWYRQALGQAWQQALAATPFAAAMAEAEQQAADGKGWPPALAQALIQQVVPSLKEIK